MVILASRQKFKMMMTKRWMSERRYNMEIQKRIELIKLLSEELLESVARYSAIRQAKGSVYAVCMGIGGLERGDTMTANKKKIQYLREQLRMLSEQLDE